MASIWLAVDKDSPTDVDIYMQKPGIGNRIFRPIGEMDCFLHFTEQLIPHIKKYGEESDAGWLLEVPLPERNG